MRKLETNIIEIHLHNQFFRSNITLLFCHGLYNFPIIICRSHVFCLHIYVRWKFISIILKCRIKVSNTINCIFPGIGYFKLPSNITFIYTSHRLSLRNRMVSFASSASSTLTLVDQRQQEEKILNTLQTRSCTLLMQNGRFFH